ncbi:MAG TPA: response regulator [Tepidisphaeraceae bacterium]|jgi:DNA-binding NtrC family response regulator
MVSQIVPISTRFPADSQEVLIVEDEQSARRALSLLLCSCGFHPQTFRTAEEAVFWLQGGAQPGAALVDLDLPGMDGIELISKLRKLSPLTRPILVTATDEDTLVRRLKPDPIPYLRKPVNFDALLTFLNPQPS